MLFEQLKSPTNDDIASITALWIAAGLIPAIRDARKDIRDCINADHGSLIIVRSPADRQIIATMMTGHDDVFGWVHYLAITGPARGRGLGWELVHLAEDIFRAARISEIRVTIETPAAGDFYRRLGYEPVRNATGQASSIPGQNTIMRKRLDQ